MDQNCDITSFENYIHCRPELEGVPDDAITLITNQYYFDTTLPDSVALSPSSSLSPASSYSGGSFGHPTDILEQGYDHDPTGITTGSGLNFFGAVPPSTLHPPFFDPNEDTTGYISQGGISPSDIFLAQQPYSDLEYLTNMPEQNFATFNDSQDFSSKITATLSPPSQQPSYSNFQQLFSEPSEDAIATGPIFSEGISPSQILSAPQQRARPPRRFLCHCGRSLTTQWNLKSHMVLHDPNHVKPYPCPNGGCPYSSDRKNDLKRHMGSCPYT